MSDCSCSPDKVCPQAAIWWLEAHKDNQASRRAYIAHRSEALHLPWGCTSAPNLHATKEDYALVEQWAAEEREEEDP